jgi:MFS family permease
MTREAETSIWRNGAFVRVWAAATVSLFGSLITRLALPYVAILVLAVGPLGVAGLRATEIVAGLLFGLVAGAWVDRLRRRPVMIVADVGRAILLGSVPLAAIGGWLSLAQLLVVAFGTAVFTAFFDAADSAYLPTIVVRAALLRANAALTASGSAAELTAFGLAGFLVAAFTAPIAIGIDALSFAVSALLLGSIRHPEPSPPPAGDREPVLTEIREGFRVLGADPIVRSLAVARVISGLSYGVFGGLWLMFVTNELGIGPIAVGLIAAVGGVASLAGATLSARLTRRWAIGVVLMTTLLIDAIAGLAIPLAPAGAPLVAAAFLIFAQLVGDSSATVFEIADVSIRQARVPERALGRVNASIRTGALLTELIGAIAAGLIAASIGLRAAVFLAPAASLLAAWFLWRSPVPGFGMRGEPIAVEPEAEPEAE